LERSTENHIEKIEKSEAVKLLLWQTMRPHDETSINRLLELFEDLLDKVPIYKMGCNKSPEAAKLSYETLVSDIGI